MYSSHHDGASALPVLEDLRHCGSKVRRKYSVPFKNTWRNFLNMTRVRCFRIFQMSLQPELWRFPSGWVDLSGVGGGFEYTQLTKSEHSLLPILSSGLLEMVAPSVLHDITFLYTFLSDSWLHKSVCQLALVDYDDRKRPTTCVNGRTLSPTVALWAFTEFRFQ